MVRFHYPNHYYYDILVGLDLLTALGYAGDKRVKPALKVMLDRGGRTENGRSTRYTPIWRQVLDIR